MTKCGYVTIIGKTNVGKSTFLNNFLEEKVSITSSKNKRSKLCKLGLNAPTDM